jgi:TetR/AcrR family transcriptional repressor of nem operon
MIIIILYDDRNATRFFLKLSTEHLIMRYEKGHKEPTRQRIVETAAARFRKDGIENVGVADLMAEAGLTHGGFYSHFSSKEDLVKTVVTEASNRSRENFYRRIEEGGLEAWIRFYLGPSHRDHPERGCFAAALGSELSRHPSATRHGFTESLTRLITNIAAHLPESFPQAQKRNTAIAIFGLLSGALQMARTVDDPAMSEEILEAGIASALELAQINPATS